MIREANMQLLDAFNVVRWSNGAFRSAPELRIGHMLLDFDERPVAGWDHETDVTREQANGQS